MNAMNRHLVFTNALSLALVIGTASARAQTQRPHERQKHGETGASMTQECQAMMAERERMMSEIRSANAKLDELVAAMNAAEGEAKVEALARVVTEMAEQRKNRTGKMMAMQPQVMQHMRKGMMEESEKAMECPMMKEMTGSPKK